MKTQFFIEDKEVSIYEYGDFKYKYGYIERTNVVDGTVHKVLTFDEEEYRKTQLRKQRKIIFVGWDKWEKAMLAGREIKDDSVYEWYYQMLDINQLEVALQNIPERVAHYLED